MKDGKTKFRRNLERKDTAIYNEFIEMINNGVMRVVAYKELASKYKKATNSGVILAIKREQKRREQKELETIN